MQFVSRQDALEKIAAIRAGEKLPPDGLRFHGASLVGVDLQGLNLAGADFTEADLSGANLKKANLFKAKLVKASLVGATIADAGFTGADLTEANMEDVHGFHAGFGMACLKNAKLFNARLDKATFTKADLTGADLRCASLRHARMREATLQDADLTGAALHSADLALSNVARATFTNSDLRETRLRMIRHFESASWIGADIREINFAGAFRLRRFIIDQNYLKEFKNAGRGARILYYIWLITSNCGRSVALWGVWIAILSLLFASIYYHVGIDFKGDESFFTALYYSVVTLTTLGYGDIVPVTKTARLIAMIEVMFGYVMLGGLLSIFSNKIARRGE